MSDSCQSINRANRKVANDNTRLDKLFYFSQRPNRVNEDGWIGTYPLKNGGMETMETPENKSKQSNQTGRIENGRIYVGQQ